MALLLLNHGAGGCKVSEPTYRFACHLLVKPPELERFYMDMKVYSVVPAGRQEPTETGALVWRGIYLAVESKGRAGKA